LRVISTQQFNFAKKQPKSHFKRNLILIGLFLFFAGLVYSLFFSGYFAIKSVNINSPEKISKTDVENIVSEWLNKNFLGIERKNNFFFLKKDKLARDLLSRTVLASTINIIRNGNNLEINIAERKPVGIWCLAVSGACCYFDENGIAYENAGQTEGFIYTLVNDKRNRQISLGSEVESSEKREWIFNIKTLLKQNGFDAAEFVFPNDLNDELEIKTFDNNNPEQKNWILKLNFDVGLEKQISAFSDLYRKKMTPDDRSRFEYVDLRIPERMYWK
jgi:hypothetical protein